MVENYFSAHETRERNEKEDKIEKDSFFRLFRVFRGQNLAFSNWFSKPAAFHVFQNNLRRVVAGRGKDSAAGMR